MFLIAAISVDLFQCHFGLVSTIGGLCRPVLRGMKHYFLLPSSLSSMLRKVFASVRRSHELYASHMRRVFFVVSCWPRNWRQAWWPRSYDRCRTLKHIIGLCIDLWLSIHLWSVSRIFIWLGCNADRGAQVFKSLLYVLDLANIILSGYYPKIFEFRVE